MTKQQELFKNAILLASSKATTVIITFLMLPILTRFLSTDEYGLVDLIVSYAMLVAPLATLQLELGVFRHLIDARGKQDEIKRVVTNAFDVVVWIVAVGVLASIVVGVFTDIPLFALIVLYVVAAMLSSMLSQIARGLGHNRAFAIANIIEVVIAAIVSIALIVMFDMGAAGWLLGMSVALLVRSAYLVAVNRLHVCYGPNCREKKMKKELLKYSIPLIPNSIAWWAINVSNRTIITIVLGVAANGIFAVASRFTAIFANIFNVFNMAWMESASLHIKGKDRDKFFSDVLDMMIKAFGSVILLGIAGIPLVFNLLVDESFVSGYRYVPVLMIGVLLSGLIGFYSSVLIAEKQTKQVAITASVAAVASVIVHLSLIWWLGLWAAAVATVVAYAVMIVHRAICVRKYVKIKYNFKLMLGLGACLALASFTYSVDILQLNLAVLAFAAIFATMVNWQSMQTMLRDIVKARKTN